MFFGTNVGHTPFVPISFPTDNSVDCASIVKTVGENTKNIRIAFFTRKPISYTTENVKSQHFLVSSNGFPDSSDFFLFKIFVSQIYINDSPNFKIAIVSSCGLDLCCYVVARWLIDERGASLNQTLLLLNNSLNNYKIGPSVRINLEKLYVHSGELIYFKKEDLPIPSKQKQANNEISIQQNLNERNKGQFSLNLNEMFRSSQKDEQLDKSSTISLSNLPPSIPSTENSKTKNEKLSKEISPPVIPPIVRPPHISSNPPSINPPSINASVNPPTIAPMKSPTIQPKIKSFNPPMRERSPAPTPPQSTIQASAILDQSPEPSPSQQPSHPNPVLEQMHKDEPNNSRFQSPLPYPPQNSPQNLSQRSPQQRESPIPYEIPSHDHEFRRYHKNEEIAPGIERELIDGFILPSPPLPHQIFIQNEIHPDYYQHDYQPYPMPPPPLPSHPNEIFFHDHYCVIPPPPPPHLLLNLSYQLSPPPLHQQHYFQNYYDYLPPQPPPSSQTRMPFYSQPPPSPPQNFFQPDPPDYYSNEYNRALPPPPPPPRQSNSCYDNRHNPHNDFLDAPPPRFMENSPSHQNILDIHENSPSSFETENNEKQLIDKYSDKKLPTMEIENMFIDSPKSQEDIPSFKQRLMENEQENRHLNNLKLDKNGIPIHPPPIFTPSPNQQQQDQNIDPKYNPKLIIEKELFHPNNELQSHLNLFGSQDSQNLSKIDESNSDDGSNLHSLHNGQIIHDIFVDIGEPNKDIYEDFLYEILGYFNFLENHLPFSEEIVLTPSSFERMKNSRFPFMASFIPNGIKCFLIIKGKKRYILSSDTYREVNLTLFSSNSTTTATISPIEVKHMEKALFEGYLTRQKSNGRRCFIITDYLVDDGIDIKNNKYIDRIGKARELLDIRNSLLNSRNYFNNHDCLNHFTNENNGIDYDDFSLQIAEFLNIDQILDNPNDQLLDFEIKGLFFFQLEATRDDLDLFFWFYNSTPIVTIHKSKNKINLAGYARKTYQTNELVEVINFGFPKKSMLHFDGKNVSLAFTPNLYKWQIKEISNDPRPWFADDVKKIIKGKIPMTYEEVRYYIDDLCTAPIYASA
ncbi:hypothetical protein TRFO_39731 [Tritrichomonas foetus]|uniref:Uncharacterized protein n=1 Tax=Tritrichomonas foetus TaxID=1144522 RepID=A0A1J4J5X8_9EUKA|nr:hypothetical protein TRFO_39731 [Tritrichomonas foetus]|eukprot:OHS94065.1 hypothetical protein TRFO_39731 [Tritrichomonas foetus]